MSTNANWGKPIIDELRLCYVAEPSLLEDLSKVEVGYSWIAPPFILFRQGGDRFEFTFAVCLGELGEHEGIGLLKYGRYGAGESPYVYFKVLNWVLYSPPTFQIAMSLPDLLGLVFNNFTAIDIAIDFRKNISTIIKRMMSEKREGDYHPQRQGPERQEKDYPRYDGGLFDIAQSAALPDNHPPAGEGKEKQGQGHYGPGL